MHNTETAIAAREIIRALGKVGIRLKALDAAAHLADTDPIPPDLAPDPGSELVFSPVYWPDFDRATLEGAIDEYRRRERRFGGLIAKTGS